MAEPDLAQFAQHVLQSRLVARESLAREVQSFRKTGRQQTARMLARQLVKADLLTRYQVRRLLAGRTEGFFLGDCRILDSLGEGGMGVVYLAEQQKLQRRVALKVLPFRPDFQSDVLLRFQREARAAAQLKHPNIVQVYDIGCDRETHFIVMEYVAGDTLAELIRRQKTFSAAQSVPLVRQAAQGLAHAHQHGVIHRDIKPSNLMLEAKTLKILDLGLARIESDEQLTGDRSVMGTLDYMSPEQCQGTRHVDHRSDLYSLGCTWFHLLSGRAPFADRRGTAKLLGHMADQLPSIADVAPETPPALARVLSRLMLRDREQRYQSAKELLNDLDELDELWDQQTLVAGTSSAAAALTDDSSDKPLEPVSGSDQTVSPRRSDDDMTLVHRPSGSAGPFYLIPVMVALVLGGVYLGIELLKGRLSDAETIVIEVPPDPNAQSATGTATLQNADLHGATSQPVVATSGSAQMPDHTGQLGSADHAQPLAEALPATNSDVTKVADGDDNSQGEIVEAAPTVVEEPKTDGTAPRPSVAETPSDQQMPERDPQEFVLRDVAESWLQDRVGGDTLTLLDRDYFAISPPVLNDRELTVQGSAHQRAVLYVRSQGDDYFWSQHGDRLTLRHVDLYIDLRGHAGRFDVFRLVQADLAMMDCSVTVLADDVRRWSTVTVVDAQSDRPWDVTAKGEPPQPTTIAISNSLLRGPGTAVRNRTSQTRIEFSNSVVAINGPILHQYHEVPFDFDHQRVEFRAENSAFDSPESFIRIDCRPPTLTPAPLTVTVNNSLLLNPGGVAEPPDLIWWATGTASSTVASSLKYAGRANVYINRTPGLSAKSTDSTRHRYVESSFDWEAQRLGLDRDSVTLGLPTRGPARSSASRSARDYAATTLLRGRSKLPMRLTEIGPDVRAVAQPRRLPSTVD